MKSKKNFLDEINGIFDKLFQYIPSYDEKKDELNYEIFDSNIFLDDFADMIEEVRCPICSQISLESNQCSKCRTLFCKKCIKEKKIIICPQCREFFEAEKIERVLNNVMGHMLIRCDNCKKYGNKLVKVKLSQIKNHLSRCNYSNYQCLICKALIIHSKEKCIEHALVCGYSDKNCSYCNKKIKLFLKNIHEKKCAIEKIECSLCHIPTLRKEYANHRKMECEFRKLRCKDCKEEYIFKEGHTKEKCQESQIHKLTIQNQELSSILIKIKDKIDISELSEKERASLSSIEKEKRELDFNPFDPKVELGVNNNSEIKVKTYLKIKFF